MPSPTFPRSLAVAAVLTIGHLLASGCTKPAPPPQFSGAEAYGRVSELVKLARHYDAADRQHAIDFIAGALKAHAATVSFQRFEATERRSGKRYQLVNVIARQNPSETKRVLLGSHWDSRLWAEQDPDTARRDQPIPGANDGGSGVAVLLELARHTAALTKLGVDYVFFDGEEMGRPGENEGYCQGSQYFAKNLSAIYPGDDAAKSPTGGKPLAAIVIDMVGDRDLNLYHEVSSVQSASAIVRGVWEQARLLGIASFHDAPRHHIIDDQTPLQKLGIPSILIIDYDYPYWHTHEDTLDKVSVESLGAVGSVLLRFLVEREKTGWNVEPERKP